MTHPKPWSGCWVTCGGVAEIPRVKFYPTSNLDAWDGRSDTSKRGEVDESSGDGVFRKGPNHPVIANGASTPTSFIEALMRTRPFEDQLISSEELVPLAAAIQWAFDTLLTERERFVMEAVWFEGLSRRELAERIPWGKSQIDRIERAARAKLAADPKLRELYELSHVAETARTLEP